MPGWRIYGSSQRISEREPTHTGFDDLSGEPDNQELAISQRKPPKPGQLVSWMGMYPCQNICQPNVDVGPVPYGTVFPSGDTEPPAHEHCQCWLDYDGSDDDLSDAGG